MKESENLQKVEVRQEGNLKALEIFDHTISMSLREQILRSHISGVLSDVERACLFGLPSTCRIREGAKIISPEKLVCGEFVWIGEGAILDASGGLKIGDHTSIGLSVFVWTHTSHEINLKMQNFPKNPDIKRTPTKIGSGCFIAGPAVIMPGVTIGNKVIITPMSVVNRDIPDGEVFSTTHSFDKRIRRIERDIKSLKGLLKKQG